MDKIDAKNMKINRGQEIHPISSLVQNQIWYPKFGNQIW